jgi:hypothetical protein
MEANELRLGNWVADAAGNYNRIAAISMPNQIETYSKDVDWLAACTVDDVSPIPLTPEILAKAGFVNGKLNKFYVFANGNLTVEGYEADYNGLYVGNIKNTYVHQLQNLYFALTGEELNIEL